MNILFWIICGIYVVFGIIIFLYNEYKYPVCQKCGNNLKTKWKRCEIHGKLHKA